jgi:hypothetical protein
MIKFSNIYSKVLHIVFICYLYIIILKQNASFYHITNRVMMLLDSPEATNYHSLQLFLFKIFFKHIIRQHIEDRVNVFKCIYMYLWMEAVIF